MLDPRRLKVTISLSGELKVYEKLAISVKGTKFTSELANSCEIRIANIDKPTRDKLVTEGTPYAATLPLKNSILIEAGRESVELHQVYVGDITTATITQAPDIWLVMRSLTGKQRKTETGILSLTATTKFSEIAKQIAQMLDIPLTFTAPDKNVANFSYSGSLESMVGALGRISLNVDAYVDDDRLIIKPRFESVGSDILDININTGLVGIPEFVGLGIRCAVLLSSEIRLGQRIRLSSLVYPAIDGEYVIFKLGFDLATRDSPFFYIIEAFDPNLGTQAE